MRIYPVHRHRFPARTFLDLFHRWIWVFIQQVVRGEDYAGSADAALCSPALQKTLLDRVQLSFTAHTLNRA